MIHIRFENPSTDRVSPQYDFPRADYVQLTHEELRFGPDGESYAMFLDGEWYRLEDMGADGFFPVELGWTDMIIWSDTPYGRKYPVEHP